LTGASERADVGKDARGPGTTWKLEYIKQHEASSCFGKVEHVLSAPIGIFKAPMTKKFGDSCLTEEFGIVQEQLFGLVNDCRRGFLRFIDIGYFCSEDIQIFMPIPS
jgi:hypothetical protein